MDTGIAGAEVDPLTATVECFLAARAVPGRFPEGGNDLAAFLPLLERVAAEYGLDVEYETGLRSLGDYACGGITVDEALPANAKLATLAHELAHALDDQGSSSAEREVIAEAVAAIVTSWLGLDPTGFPPTIAHELSRTGETSMERYAPTIEAVARLIEIELATLGLWDS
jgi:hypothetical protein